MLIAVVAILTTLGRIDSVPRIKVLIPLILSTIATCHRVTESVEDVPDPAQNTTTLYPVSNKTVVKEKDSKPQPTKEKTKISDATLWKLNTSYGESDGDTKEEKSIEDEVSSDVNKTTDDKEFKPSPHLGTFVDDESFEITPTKATIGDFRPLKKPPIGFLSSPKDQFKSSLYNKDPFRHHNDFPYKIESGIFTKPKGSWRPADLDSRPTVEAPLRVPAGGLYRSPDAFKDKPITADDDYGLDFNDLKENNHLDIKKRVNPWKNLLHLITALIPVGLIVSALTPSIITVHSTDPGTPYSGSVFRRSDASIDALSPISERCRRRLLCELQAEHTYTQPHQASRRRGRQCSRILCEDPQALSNMLQWLLSRQQASARGQHLT